MDVAKLKGEYIQKIRVEKVNSGILKGREEEQDLPSQNMPPWYKDYFELKTVKTQQFQENLFTSLLNCLPVLGKELLIRDTFKKIIRDTFLPKKFICITGQPLFSKQLLCISRLVTPFLFLTPFLSYILYKLQLSGYILSLVSLGVLYV